jgi:hypothetical protein
VRGEVEKGIDLWNVGEWGRSFYVIVILLASWHCLLSSLQFSLFVPWVALD